MSKFTTISTLAYAVTEACGNSDILVIRRLHKEYLTLCHMREEFQALQNCSLRQDFVRACDCGIDRIKKDLNEYIDRVHN